MQGLVGILPFGHVVREDGLGDPIHAVLIDDDRERTSSTPPRPSTSAAIISGRSGCVRTIYFVDRTKRVFTGTIHVAADEDSARDRLAELMTIEFQDAIAESSSLTEAWQSLEVEPRADLLRRL